MWYVSGRWVFLSILKIPVYLKFWYWFSYFGFTIHKNSHSDVRVKSYPHVNRTHKPHPAPHQTHTLTPGFVFLIISFWRFRCWEKFNIKYHNILRSSKSLQTNPVISCKINFINVFILYNVRYHKKSSIKYSKWKYIIRKRFLHLLWDMNNITFFTTLLYLLLPYYPGTVHRGSQGR